MKYLNSLLFISLIIVFSSSCTTTKKKYVKDPSLSYFGEVISPDKYIKIEDMLATLEKTGKFEGKVRGTVTAVCQKKGCWMTLATPVKDQDIFIKFKDYGFFMPFELSGSDVVIRGTAEKEITSVQELRHYAMDGGATKEESEEITEPETSFRFLADGVVVVK